MASGNRLTYLRRAFHSSVTLIVMLLLGNCALANPSGSNEGNQPMATVTLTLADTGKSVDVTAGDTIAVRLEENPTTGYRWASGISDEQIVAVARSDYVPAGNAVGGGGTRTFTLQALKAGTATLDFKLWREWEGDASAIERFRATVRVR